jgi:hypothetical protein
LIATEKHGQVASFNPLQLPLVYPGSGKIAQELVMLDARKRAVVGSVGAGYMTVWSPLRERVVAPMTAS